MKDVYRDRQAGRLAGPIAFGALLNLRLELQEGDETYGPGVTIKALMDMASDNGGSVRLEDAPIKVALQSRQFDAAPGDAVDGVAVGLDRTRIPQDLDQVTLEKVLFCGYISKVALTINLQTEEVYLAYTGSSPIPGTELRRLHGTSGGDFEDFSTTTIVSMTSFFDNTATWTKTEDGVWVPPTSEPAAASAQ